MFFWNSYGLQDAMSPIMEEFIFFHDYLMVVLIYIIIFVMSLFMFITSFYWMNLNLVHEQFIEGVWTTIPAVILTIVSIPSLLLLYSIDETSSAILTMKVIGHQWYWSYEMSDFWVGENMVEFDSYMLSSEELSSGMLRLLDTDNRPALPYLSQIRVLVSSADVLHSWAIPSLGVKMDAIPGRLNQTKLMSYRPGLAYGQCSEICGANHSFMPIIIEFVGINDFLEWVNSFSE